LSRPLRSIQSNVQEALVEKDVVLWEMRGYSIDLCGELQRVNRCAGDSGRIGRQLQAGKGQKGQCGGGIPRLELRDGQTFGAGEHECYLVTGGIGGG